MHRGEENSCLATPLVCGDCVKHNFFNVSFNEKKRYNEGRRVVYLYAENLFRNIYFLGKMKKDIFENLYRNLLL